MTNRGLCTCSGVLLIACVVFAVVTSRWPYDAGEDGAPRSETGDSDAWFPSPSTGEPAHVENHSAATGMGDIGLGSGAVDSWWQFTPVAAEACGCLPTPWRMVNSGGPNQLSQLASITKSGSSPLNVFAVSIGGRRIPLASAMGQDGMGLFRQTVPLVTLSVRVVDRESGASVSGTLLDDHNTPLGCVGPHTDTLVLPKGFAGSLTAPGFAPEPVRIEATAGSRLALVWSLNRWACVRGRLPHAVDPGRAKLLMHHPATLPSVRTSSFAAVYGDGAFHCGPTVAGPHSLFLESPQALLDPTARNPLLRQGPNDLGELPVELLRPMYIRFRGGWSEPHETVFLRMWFSEGSIPRDLPAVGYKTPDDGLVIVTGVRDTPLTLCAWTEGGWSGRLVSVLARHTTPDAPLEFPLSSPAEILISVKSLGFPIPDGCALVLHPPDTGILATRFVSAEPGPQFRLRRAVLSRLQEVRLTW